SNRPTFLLVLGAHGPHRYACSSIDSSIARGGAAGIECKAFPLIVCVPQVRCWQHWHDEYYTEVKPQSIPEPERQQHIMEAFLLGTHHTKKADEFRQYLNEPPVHISDIKAFDLIAWWDASRTEYPTLSQYALDTLAIPATATECERTFSSAKRLVTPERNCLGDDVIEASECL